MNRLLRLVLLTGLLLSSGLSGTAQPPEEPIFGGLDILFLVDQSGSMGGRDFGYTGGSRPAADPLGLRFEAVNFALNVLTEYRLSVAQDVPMQFAVINFGDEPSSIDVDRGWITIAPDGGEAEWDRILQELTIALSAESFRERSSDGTDFLGNTNFLGAFNAAQAMFESLPTPAGPPHLGSIVLLTDGAPCAPALFDCEGEDAQRDHMQQVLATAQAQFPAERYAIYVIALDDTGSLWSSWRDEWEAITQSSERAVHVTSSQEIGVEFFDIIIELVNRVRGSETLAPLTLQPGQPTVRALPAYLREARISIFKSSTAPGSLDIIKPDGQPLPASDVTVSNADRPIEIWTIPNPDPGEWIFTAGSAEDRLDIRLELIPVDVRVSLDSGPFIQFEPIDVTVTLADGSGNPLVIQPPPMDLLVEATVTAPNGTVTSLPLQLASGSTYVGTLATTESGRYELGLTAVTHAMDGKQYTVVDQPRLGSLEVLGIVLTSEMLPEGSYLAGETLSITVMIADSQGAPLILPDLRLSAEISTQDFNSMVYPMQNTGTPGEYALSVPLTEPGNYDLTIRALATSADREIALTAPLQAQFGVTRSEPVLVSRLLPAIDAITQPTHEGFPPFNATDLEIVVQTALGTSGDPVNVETVAIDPDSFWQITVLRDGAALPETTPLTMEALSEPGQYRLLLRDPGTGIFTITIDAAGDLRDQFLIAGDGTVRATITRQLNPLTVGFFATIALAVLLSAGFVGLRARRNARLRLHPARGILVLRNADEPESDLWTKNLDAHKKNRLVLADKTLRKLGVKHIIVESRNDHDAERGRVYVTVEMEGNKRFENRSLNPGGTIRLSGGRLLDESGSPDEPTYELVKDPDSNWLA